MEYTTPRRLLAVVGVAALVVTVAACGSSSKSSSNTTAGASAPTSGGGSSGGKATGAPIKLGMICSCSGPFGTNFVAAEEVYKSWVNTVNNTGGLEGHPIQLTVDDDAATPGTSVTDAQKLISAGVDAIVDESVVDEPWASAVQSAKIPVVGGDESENPFFQNPDFYPQGQTNDTSTYAVVATGKLAGATNFGDLYCAESVSCQEGISLLKSAAAKVGIPLTFNAEVSATAPNYTAQCVAAKQGGVTAVFIGDSPNVVGRIGADCAQQGYMPIYLTEGEGFANSLLTYNGIKDNLWSEYSQLPYFANTPAVQAMNTAVDKYYPTLRSSTTSWTEIAAEAWAAGLLLRDAVKAGGITSSGTPSATEITNGLDSLKGDTLDGWAPPLTFTAGKPHSVGCWFTGRVTNGTPTLADNGKVSCEPGYSGASS